MGLWYTISSRYPIGTNIYEREWDAAIILDACRKDAISEISDEYDFINTVDSIWSVGSATPEWLANTFTSTWSDEIKQTVRISANGYDTDVIVNNNRPKEWDKTWFGWPRWNTVNQDYFLHLEMMWQDHDAALKTVPPNRVTDRAIKLGRDYSWNRLMSTTSNRMLHTSLDRFKTAHHP